MKIRYVGDFRPGVIAGEGVIGAIMFPYNVAIEVPEALMEYGILESLDFEAADSEASAYTPGPAVTKRFVKVRSDTGTLEDEFGNPVEVTGTGGDGTPGSKQYRGTTAPPGGTGIVGDFYLRTTTYDYYEKTGASTWTLVGNFKGVAGTNGTNGTNGLSAPWNVSFSLTGLDDDSAANAAEVPFTRGATIASARVNVPDGSVGRDLIVAVAKNPRTSPVQAFTGTNRPTVTAQTGRKAKSTGAAAGGSALVDGDNLGVYLAQTPAALPLAGGTAYVGNQSGTATISFAIPSDATRGEVMFFLLRQQAAGATYSALTTGLYLVGLPRTNTGASTTHTVFAYRVPDTGTIPATVTCTSSSTVFAHYARTRWPDLDPRTGDSAFVVAQAPATMATAATAWTNPAIDPPRIEDPLDDSRLTAIYFGIGDASSGTRTFGTGVTSLLGTNNFAVGYKVIGQSQAQVPAVTNSGPSDKTTGFTVLVAAKPTGPVVITVELTPA